MQQAFERKEKQVMSSPKAKYKLESIKKQERSNLKKTRRIRKESREEDNKWEYEGVYIARHNKGVDRWYQHGRQHLGIHFIQ